MDRIYVAIDLKSFYASVECVERKLDPLQTNLVVADPTRTEKTICLAVSPSLKKYGIPGRARLFEVVQKVEQINNDRRYKAPGRKFAGKSIWSFELERHPELEVDYVVAPPQMAHYMKVSAQIYGIYLKYVSPEDVHVYSIDECFIDCTPYLHLYKTEADKWGSSSAHVMAMTMIRDVLRSTGITATVGIGTNLYLAKVAMDIVAKKAPADKDGVRIASLTEDSYKFLLWDHKPLTDFWQIGHGKAGRLERNQILIDHAWGIEPVTMYDIKHYKSDNHSLSNGQVLPHPYKYEEACLVLREMIDILCCDMYKKNLISSRFTWWISYDYKSLEHCPNYDGPVSIDWYGRLHPAHSNGTVRLPSATNISSQVCELIMQDVKKKSDHRLLFRRLGICACDVKSDEGMYQMDLFTDYDALNKERQLYAALLEVRTRYGANSLLKGMNLMEGATTIERNQQIGGHRA